MPCHHLGKTALLYAAGPIASTGQTEFPQATDLRLAEGGVWSVTAQIDANPSTTPTQPNLVVLVDGRAVGYLVTPQIGAIETHRVVQDAFEFRITGGPGARVQLMRQPNADAGNAAIALYFTLKVCGCGGSGGLCQ